MDRAIDAMISAEFCVAMARYNEWMNHRLYALCATLPPAELERDRGAFFKSIYGTLNHIAYADLAFLSRFTGAPAEVPELGVMLYRDFTELQRARSALDQRLCAWAAALQPEWLRTDLTYTSKVDGVRRTRPKWLLVTHLYNHQTHHRGQATTLLAQMGLDVGSTDLPFMPEPTAQADTP
jgi:uncharacterized damage-inducible protein DinB